MSYRHIVFDVDGTLMDSEEANLRSMQDMMETVTGRRPPAEELLFAMGIPGEDSLKRLDLPDPAGALALWEKNLEGYRGLVRPFEGIPELIEELARRGCGLGVATSRTRQEFEVDFAGDGIGRFFPVVITADDTALHKPHPDPLLRYMELTHSRPEELLYIGDSEYDQRCAQSAGVAFALAGWGVRGERDVPLRLDRPAQVLDLLE